ncbi:hypothetical protein [Coleofasciculus sp. FACHB-T130]|uniref:hypothetical protein n=1 Tax=Cyanophyceae TaxID=3028117 RepID=UPI0016837916|nr:hypothetical protein [Coleofasciculus sp. FACHB-T130]MBD1878556.1 hypothetical protein [Coleofasciculus sp. FACHB-T130]
MTDEFRPVDIHELLKQTQDERDERLKNGIQTSEHILSFEPSNLTIQIRLQDNPNTFYREVDLEKCIDASSLLAQIWHLHSKKWDDDNGVITAFLSLFKDVLAVTFINHSERRLFTATDIAHGVTLNWSTKTATFPKT